MEQNTKTQCIDMGAREISELDTSSLEYAYFVQYSFRGFEGCSALNAMPILPPMGQSEAREFNWFMATLLGWSFCSVLLVISIKYFLIPCLTAMF